MALEPLRSLGRRTAVRLALAACLVLLATPPAAVALTAPGVEILYSFRSGDGGGLAAIEIDPETGLEIGHRTLWRSDAFPSPSKFALSADGSIALLVGESDRSGNLVLIPLRGEGEPRSLDFPSIPDEVRAMPGGFVVGGDGGNLVAIDAVRGRISARWSSRESLRPSGHKPEDIAVLAEQGLAVVSFQKDSSSGKHRGSRVAVLRLPGLSLVADLELPRDRPELHIPGNRKEQGPNPEVLVLCPRTNTMLLTLDLYGAVLLSDLDAVLEGRLANGRMLSADPQGRFGVAFPDRAARMAIAGGEAIVIANAGEDGGVAAFDLAGRRRFAAGDAPPGLDTLVHLPTIGAVAAATAGKIKRRSEDEVVKGSRPGREIGVIDLSRLGSGEMPLSLLGVGEPCHAIAAIDPSRGAKVLAVLGGDRRTLALLEIARGENGRFLLRELWRTAAAGEIQRVARRP